MLPQSPGVAPETCIPELEKCVREYGAVAINLNPDPSGGHWTSPPLTDRHWYPIYEKMVEHDLPAMIHVSTSCNPCFHTTGAHYINADTTAFMQLHPGRPVQGLPDAALRHPARRRRGALPLGALPRPRAGAEEAAAEGPPPEQRLLRHLRLPPAGHRPADARWCRSTNILFASEMIGAVRGVDPETGHHYDDTKRYVEASTQLTPAQTAADLRGQRPARLPAPRRRAREGRGSDHVRDRSRLSQHPARRRRTSSTSWPRFGTATVHEAMGRVGLLKPLHAPDLRGRAGVGHGGDRAAAAGRQLDAARGGRADAAGRRRRRRRDGRVHATASSASCSRRRSRHAARARW